MPYHVEFMHQGTGIHFTGVGIVLGSELVAGAAEVHREEARVSRLRYALVDLTGMARIWQAFVEDTGWKTAVFRSRSEAIDWLRENKVWSE